MCGSVGWCSLGGRSRRGVRRAGGVSPSGQHAHRVQPHIQSDRAGLRRRPPGQPVQPRPEDRHRHHRHRPLRAHRRRQLHGHDQLQDRQAAADDQQLLPVLSGRRGLRCGAHIDAALHHVHDIRLLAAGAARVRHLARAGLLGVERVSVEPVDHQFRQVL